MFTTIPDLLTAARDALAVARCPQAFTEQQYNDVLDVLEAAIERAEGANKPDPDAHLTDEFSSDADIEDAENEAHLRSLGL
jgi:hypothetical protein